MSMVDWLIPPRLQRLLAALLLHPEQSYSVTDLIKIAGVGSRSGQTAINSMVAAGVLHESRLGNQRRLRANRDYPLYAELREICVKSFGVADKVRLLVGQFPGIGMAFVFGSVAKGADRSQSDIDVIAVGTIGDPVAWSNEIYALELTLGRSVHVSLYDPQEWARLIAEDPVIRSIWAGPKVMVIDNGETAAGA